jgi:hypothetical protein
MVDDLAGLGAAVPQAGGGGAGRAAPHGQAPTRDIQTMSAALNAVGMLFLVLFVWLAMLAMKRAGKPCWLAFGEAPRRQRAGPSASSSPHGPIAAL